MELVRWVLTDAEEAKEIYYGHSFNEKVCRGGRSGL